MPGFSFTEFLLTVQGMEPGKLTREMKQSKIMHIQYVIIPCEPCSSYQILCSSIFTLPWGSGGMGGGGGGGGLRLRLYPRETVDMKGSLSSIQKRVHLMLVNKIRNKNTVVTI